MRKKYKEPKPEEVGEMLADLQIQMKEMQREIYEMRQLEREHDVGRLARRPVEDLTFKEHETYNKIHDRVKQRYGYTDDEADEYMQEY